MFGARMRSLLLIAAAALSMLTTARAANVGAAIGPLELHREAVDERSYPWAAVGKLFTEGGSECSGVLIARDKVLTAAHCLFNYRTRRYIAADALHFLVGYRTGRYSAHVRISRYEVGAGFDPLRYDQTNDLDWAVLTVVDPVPASIVPLRPRRDAAPSGTKAVLVGYPQDRALAMTADRNCELGDKIDDGRMFLHTCRGIKGYSGAPILVSVAGGEVQIAGIQVATMQQNGKTKAIAVPAQAFWRQDRDGIPDVAPVVVVVASVSKAVAACGGPDDMIGPGDTPLEAIQARLAFEEPDIVASIPDRPATAPSSALAWLALGANAVAYP
jgi:protease YdgD